jgi:hypothetical protein
MTMHPQVLAFSVQVTLQSFNITEGNYQEIEFHEIEIGIL